MQTGSQSFHNVSRSWFISIVNLAENRLSSIPSELLGHVRLVEWTVSRNRLSKILFPPQIRSTEALGLLDISQNLLHALTSARIEMSKLQTANMSGNRLRSLPDISKWTELLTLTAAENMISEIPRGFVKLSKLKNADCQTTISHAEREDCNHRKSRYSQFCGKPTS
jgi:Leucine-rich repeat (LRR) protein